MNLLCLLIPLGKPIGSSNPTGCYLSASTVRNKSYIAIVTGKMFLPKRGKDVFQSNGKDVFL